jgi:protein-S-isoprenylcysteine O-methyltransferase Ste14
VATRNSSRAASPLRLILGSLLATGLDALLLAIALGGLQPLLGHSRALALLVVWGAGGLALALLRPVRTHQPIVFATEPPSVLAALFVIPLVIPPLSAYAERVGWWPLPGGIALRWSGVVLSAAGLVLRIVAMAQLGSRFSPFVAVQKEHALETRGVYRMLRHPGYLGSWLASLGAVLAFGTAVTLPLAALFLFVLAARARREEGVLEKHFGDDYRGYRKRTIGMIPGW